MKTQNRLINRIRGWFPQNPKIPEVSVLPNPKINTLNPNGQQSSPLVFQAVVYSVSADLLGLFWFALPIRLGVIDSHISVYWEIISIMLGVAFGVIIGVAPTLRVLKTLKKKGQANYWLPLIVMLAFLFAALFVLILIPAILVPHENINLINETQYPMGITFVTAFVALITWVDVQAALLKTWERKNKLQIRLTKGFKIFTVPSTK